MSAARMPVLAAFCLCLLLATPTAAIETDQYYAWGRELADSTEMINAKVNSEILLVLERVNSTRSWDTRTCEDMAKRIERHFRLFIFHDLQLWADNTSLIERFPSTAEEDWRYRKEYIYRNHGPLDVGTWMPPSPTIELAGVRMGTDKLTHFFSEGWMSYVWYRNAREKGVSEHEAEVAAVRKGILLERSVLGMAASGVFSLADLEANYQGLRFFKGLCGEESPRLVMKDDGWQLASLVDFRDYVTPEWDESYQPSVFGKRRWKKVRPVLLEYCPMLDDPEVARRRAAYRERDTITFTEGHIEELIEEGRLIDPDQFSIDHLCSSER
jgi:hypothetical protein